ncbi:MAG: preprotein translocase subunit SecG [Bradymonadaceae bacterium]
MEIFLIVVHAITSVVLVLVILLQSGKGGGMGSGFGGAAAAGQQIFGGRGAATFLSKATVGLAVIFMTTSLSLAWLSSAPRSALDLTSAPDVAQSSQVDQIIDQGGAGSVAPQEEPVLEAPPVIEHEAPPVIDLAPAPTEEAPVEEVPVIEEMPAPAEMPEEDPLQELEEHELPRP